MAVDYSLPSFLTRPTDTVNPLLQGLHLGAQIAQQRNALQVEAQNAAMQAAARAEEANRRAIMEQQQIELDKARAVAMQGLKKQELDQAQQTIDLQVQKAARQVQAHARYQQLLQGGEDPAKALLQVGPDLGISMTGAAQLYKAGLPQPALPPPELQNYAGQPFLKVPERGGAFRYQQIRQPAEKEAMTGPVRGEDVLDPQGNRVPGLLAVPTAGGGRHVLNVPDRMVRMAQAEIVRMEKDPAFGIYLTTDREPTKADDEKKADFDKKLAAFKAFKAKYEKLRSQVDSAIEAGANRTSRGTVGSAPHPEGTILRNKKDGTRWIVQDGQAVPYNDHTEEADQTGGMDEEP